MNDRQLLEESPVRVSLRPLLVFLALAFALTWGLDALNLLLRPPDVVTAVLLELANAGPSLAALVVVAVTAGRTGLRAVARRMLAWRVGRRWWLLVLVTFPALLVGGYWAASMVDGQPFVTAFPGGWWVAPLFLPLIVLTGPLGEEVGWRGFALPLLLRRGPSWVTAGTVLGLIWAVWHRTPSTWASTWLSIASTDLLDPTGPLGLVLTGLVPDVALSVLMAWVYVRTGGSALLAGLGMHTAANWALFSIGIEPSWATVIALPTVLGLLAVAAVLIDRRRSDRSRPA